jgi:uncharacterized protein (TIGR03435 family)
MKRATIAALALCGIAFGQADDQKLMFDVASVRLSKPLPPPNQFMTRMTGGPGTNDPAQIHWENVSLRIILKTAYGLKDIRLVLAGKDPSILATSYDIVANVPAGTTPEQFNVMLRNLLIERLKLAVHREMRSIPVYQLVIAKGGLKMKESVETPGKPLDPLPAAKGFPAIPAGRPAAWTRTRDGHQLFRARALPLSCEPVAALGCELFMSPVLMGGIAADARIVENKTGLTGKYDFTLDCMFDDKAGPPVAGDIADGPSCFDAIEQQLGLKLVDTKEPMEVLVVDRVEKPAEN